MKSIRVHSVNTFPANISTQFFTTCAIVVVSLVLDAAFAVEPSASAQSESQKDETSKATDEEIRQWIRELDSPKFVERQRACQKLVDAAPASIGAVVVATKSENRNMRAHATSVLAAIKRKFPDWLRDKHNIEGTWKVIEFQGVKSRSFTLYEFTDGKLISTNPDGKFSETRVRYDRSVTPQELDILKANVDGSIVAFKGVCRVHENRLIWTYASSPRVERPVTPDNQKRSGTVSIVLQRVSVP